MTAVWWGRESSEAERNPEPPRRDPAPVLVQADGASIQAKLDDRADSFTPEWTSRNSDEDAGVALRQLFCEQMEAVAQRLDFWPDKAFVDFLNIAGVAPLPGSAAETLLEFEVSDDAPQSVQIPEGFQVGARPRGATSLVVFETERSFFASPGKIGEAFVASGRTFDQVDPTASFEPFGDNGRASLLVGLTGKNAPSQTITLGIGIASPAGAPPPVGAGGTTPLPVPSGPVLAWEILDGGSSVELEVIRDETGGLVRSGLVELALPRQWRAGAPAGMPKAISIRWLSLRVAYGRFASSPKLSFVKVNVARAFGARTIRDEVLQPVPGTNGSRMCVSQTPVVPGSLLLEVDESGLQLGAAANATAWSEVDDLSLYGPDSAVYVIDNAAGELTFGDGHYGKGLPQGFRNVRATSYRVMSQAPESIDAGAISTVLTSLEFVNKVSNPVPASGGGPGETVAQALKRGPQEIRTRRRAVTVADYALLAMRADGALIARAFAVSGLHPQYPGRPIPGVVGVYVVPPDRGEGAPTPDPETLRAVAGYLADAAAPAGVEIVAAAPRYHNVEVDAGIVIEPGSDAGATLRNVIIAINAYLHPIIGGETQDGWPFGGAIRYVPLLRLISRVEGVRAVKRLNVLRDGLRWAACTDVPLAPYALPWPSGHQIFTLDDGAAS
jgi:predicted phage baseplate assembly protein